MNSVRECPICGWYGEEFLPRNLNFSHDDSRQIHRDNKCPKCSSGPRHRSAWLTMHMLNLTGENKDVLHVAPEPFLVDLFRKNSKRYIAIDKYIDNRFGNIQVKEMDLTELTFLDNNFDFIYCAHVLEHIPDDIKAISELYRVLKPGGTAVLSVPIYPIEKTADLYPLSPDGMGHVHQPGKDYFKRYINAGFLIDIIYPEDFFNMEKYSLRAIWDPIVIAKK